MPALAEVSGHNSNANSKAKRDGASLISAEKLQNRAAWVHRRRIGGAAHGGDWLREVSARLLHSRELKRVAKVQHALEEVMWLLRVRGAVEESVRFEHAGAVQVAGGSGVSETGSGLVPSLRRPRLADVARLASDTASSKQRFDGGKLDLTGGCHRSGWRLDRETGEPELANALIGGHKSPEQERNPDAFGEDEDQGRPDKALTRLLAESVGGCPRMLVGRAGLPAKSSGVSVQRTVGKMLEQSRSYGAEVAAESAGSSADSAGDATRAWSIGAGTAGKKEEAEEQEQKQSIHAHHHQQSLDSDLFSNLDLGTHDVSCPATCHCNVAPAVSPLTASGRHGAIAPADEARLPAHKRESSHRPLPKNFDEALGNPNLELSQLGAGTGADADSF